MGPYLNQPDVKKKDSVSNKKNKISNQKRKYRPCKRN